MAVNRGKDFEKIFKQDFLEMEGATIDRLYDVMSGYKHISQISDFIGYRYPNIFYLECKSHLGNTFPLSNLTQYDKLVKKVGIKGVRTGVVIWFIDHNKVVYVPIREIRQMKKDGKKSVNINMLNEGVYKIVDIPSTKLVVYMHSDYSVLMNLEDGD